jgi:hypothetical protein
MLAYNKFHSKESPKKFFLIIKHSDQIDTKL